MTTLSMCRIDAVDAAVVLLLLAMLAVLAATLSAARRLGSLGRRAGKYQGPPRLYEPDEENP